MTTFSRHHWASIFGVLGDIIGFIVFLSPLPTFYKIYKKKSTEGYQSIPYVIALFSAMLWIYYAFLETNLIFLTIINTFGCFIETIYVGFYLFYAPKKARVETVKLLLVLVVGGFGAIVLVVQFLFKGVVRGQIVGWICLVFNICTFAAPLCIVRQVIKTKSVEYMPLLLSVFLTISAVLWFFYGLLVNNILVIAVPNVLGFIFGILQIVLYVIYNKKEKVVLKEQKFTELQNHVIILEEQKLRELTKEEIIDIIKAGPLVCSENINVASRTLLDSTASGAQARNYA